MKYLVTGTTGFVGKHLSQHLKELDHEVVGVGTSKNEASEYFINLDLLNSNISAQIDFSQFDGIFHLAGLAAVGPSFNNPKKYLRVNTEIEINIFEAILSQNCSPRVIVVSSGGVYDPSKLPVNEESALLPANPYAVSKIAQEYVGLYYNRKGLDVVIARPFNHCGPGQGAGFLVADLAKQVLSAEKYGKEIIVGDLSSERDYTDVRDIVRAYTLLMDKGISGEIYNVCSGVPRSGEEILSLMAKKTDSKITVKIDKTLFRAAEHKKIVGSYKKLAKDTGWKPEFSFDKTISDTLDYWRKLN